MKYIRSDIPFRKIGIRSGIPFQKIGIRNGYVFEVSMARPRPKSSQVHSPGVLVSYKPVSYKNNVYVQLIC